MWKLFKNGNLTKNAPEVCITVSNKNECKLKVHMYQLNVDFKEFKPSVDMCLNEIQTNLSEISQNIEKQTETTKGNVSIYLNVEFNPVK